MSAEPAAVTIHPELAWVYRGVWGVLARWFKVPPGPPTLPAVGGHEPVSMRPARGFLKYLRVLFVIGWIGPAFGVAAGLAALAVAVPVAGVLLALPAVAVLALLMGASWIGLHLQYDTQWYVLSDRSVRIRRGIWVIQETTITFENVQDVKVLQGPLQRAFGIADIILETAGGGSGGGREGQHVSPHSGFLQGIGDAAGVKELIAGRVRASRSAGLGDEHLHDHRPAVKPPAGALGGAAHVEMLRQILAEVRAARVP